MLRLISDQNFNGPILRGLFRRQPDLDPVRAFDVGLATATDPVLLAWAAEEGRSYSLMTSIPSRFRSQPGQAR